MTTRSSTMRLSMLVLAAGATSRAALAQDDAQFLMLDKSLRSTLVNVASIGPSAVRIINEKNEVNEVPFDAIVALAPGWWRSGTEGSELAWIAEHPSERRGPATNLGVLTLTDGRRIVGGLVPGAEGEQVIWEHSRLGRSVFELDDVRRMTFRQAVGGGRGADEKRSEDRVVTTNADEVTGFVDSIGNTVKIEADGKKVELAIRQIAAIELANPAKKPVGSRLWLLDGSVVGSRGFGAATEAGDLQVQVDSPAASDTGAVATIAMSELVAFTPDSARIAPLAGLTVESQKGVGERRYVEPIAYRWRGEALSGAWQQMVSPGDSVPPLDAPDIELPGPMIVEWTLPPGASRIAGWAEVPPESRLWAEFTLVVEGVSAGKASALASESMSGTRPIVEFNIELPRPAPERLRISMDAGARGPIQDRVVLRRALVLIEASK